MTLIKYSPIIYRVPSGIDRTRGITTYDLDNLYPQRMEQLSFRSPIVESSLDAINRFVRGAGFEQNGDVVVNRWGQTLNNILKAIVSDDSSFTGWALHLNINILGGVTEITPTKFKIVRYGLPDENGRHFDVKTSLNWPELSVGYLKYLEQVREFPLWHVRNESIIENIEESNGYINYVVPEMDEYPRSTFDSVAESAQTNSEIQVFELGSIQNSFLGTSIFKHPGKLEEPDKTNVINDLHELTGARSAGSAYLLEVPDDFDGQIIENFPANNNDRLFELTNDNTEKRIITRFAVPYPILGMAPKSGGIFNEQELQDSYTYMNARTVDKRSDIVSELKKVLDFWHTGPIETGEILTIDFETMKKQKVDGGKIDDNKD